MDYRPQRTPQNSIIMHNWQSMLFAAAVSLAVTAQSRLILYYPLNETSGQQANDFSGNNRHGRYVNGPQLQGSNGARLDGVDDYIQLPNDLMFNQYSISASVEVLIRPEQNNYYFIWGIGNTGSNGDGNGYVFVTGDPELRAAITPSNWDAEAEVRTNAPLPRNEWRTVTFVIESAAGRIALYQNGAFVGGRTNNDPIVAPGLIGTGTTQANYIGRSTFRSDKYLAGSVRNFRLWDHALSANEVASLGRPQFPGGGNGSGGNGGGNQGGGSSAEDRVTIALVAINIPNLEDVRGDINLPTNSQGVPVVWSSDREDVISNTGRVNRPLEDDVVVTLTARVSFDGASGERSFFAFVRHVGT